jgi:hypothetical protein
MQAREGRDIGEAAVRGHELDTRPRRRAVGPLVGAFALGELLDALAQAVVEALEEAVDVVLYTSVTTA